MSTPFPTGQQFEIRSGNATATITEVGATLRTFTVGDRDVIVGFAADELPPASHGAVLIPWPNRIRDGRYTWDGQDYQLALSEPQRGTAIHGLVTTQRWQVTEHTESEVELAIEPPATLGYPFTLRCLLRYTLDGASLTISLRTENLGSADAPYGVGFHPWLSPGPGSLDDCELQLDATKWIPTDDRLLPTGVADMPAEFDFRSSRRMGATALDDAFVGATYDADGLSWLRLRGSDAQTASVWMDGSMTCWQMCTGDEVAAVAAQRTGLAAEPMTCVADAFRTGDDLIRLAPGAHHQVRWGITLS